MPFGSLWLPVIVSAIVVFVASSILHMHEFEIAMALVRPAAISHWSALSHHGLTEQVPRKVFVLTTARSVPRARGARHGRSAGGYPVAGTRNEFIQTKPGRFFGIDEVWVGEARIRITDPERTLLDGLTAPQHCGGLPEVLHAFTVRGPQLEPLRAGGPSRHGDAPEATPAHPAQEKWS